MRIIIIVIVLIKFLINSSCLCQVNDSIMYVDKNNGRSIYLHFEKNSFGEINKGKSIKLKVHHKKDQKYFLLNGEIYYININIKHDFSKVLCDKIDLKVDHSRNENYMPSISVIFFINSNGKIIQKGLLRPDFSNNYYNEVVKNALFSSNEKIVFPSLLINGEKVSYVFTMVIYFGGITTCKQIVLFN